MNEPIHTEQYRGLTIEVHYDEDALSPREDDNVGIILGFRNLPLLTRCMDDTLPYSADDYFGETIKELVEELAEGGVVLAFKVYDTQGGYRLDLEPVDWDKHHTYSGFVYITGDRMNQEWDDTPNDAVQFQSEVIEQQSRMEQQAIACIEAEIATYNQYLAGEVYAYVITDEDGEVLDSCHGYYDEDNDFAYLLSEARASADYHADRNEDALRFAEDGMVTM